MNEDPELQELLRSRHPVPDAGFRGRLRQHLAYYDPGHGPRPKRLPLLVGAYFIAGLLLLAFGLLTAVGWL